MSIMIYENDMKNVDYPFKCAVMKGDLPFMNHCHQELEILMLQKGYLQVFCEDVEYELKEGDIWIIPPFVSHAIGKGKMDCARIVVLLDLQFFVGSMKENQEFLWIRQEMEKKNLISRYWDHSTKIFVTGIIDQMYKEYTGKRYAWKFSEKVLISELLLAIIRQTPEKKNKISQNKVVRIKNILEYIALHYDKDITLQSCADAVGFNSTYLSRYFSNTMGVTFQEYIKRLRIDRAKWLLMTEKLSVMEICTKSGFRDIKTFNKLFKKECGMCPTMFRKALLSERTDL